MALKHKKLSIFIIIPNIPNILNLLDSKKEYIPNPNPISINIIAKSALVPSLSTVAPAVRYDLYMHKTNVVSANIPNTHDIIPYEELSLLV